MRNTERMMMMMSHRGKIKLVRTYQIPGGSEGVKKEKYCT
jgi:hypothetical protein